MIKKYVAWVAAAAIAAAGAFLTACAAGPTVPSSKSSQGEEPRLVIGMTMAGINSPFLLAISKYAQIEAEVQDVELVLTDAGWDAQKQADQINGFIAQGVDAIILNPVDASSLLPSLKKIKAAGIPCINVNMKVDDISSAYITSYVGASMQAEARMAADLTDKALAGNGGSVVIIEGAPGSDAQIYRTKSYVDQITSKYRNIKILGIANGQWDRSKAMAACQDLLTKYASVDVVYCHDDNMAIGAIQAAKAAGRFDKIKFIGIGGSLDGINGIKSGDLYGSVSQPPDYEGKTAIRAAVNAAKGLDVTSWYRDPVAMITSGNVMYFEGLW